MVRHAGGERTRGVPGFDDVGAPFDILTHLLGSEASSPSLAAAGASLAAHGRWQAGRWDAKQPTSAEALVGSLSAHRRSAALLDGARGRGISPSPPRRGVDGSCRTSGPPPSAGYSAPASRTTDSETSSTCARRASADAARARGVGGDEEARVEEARRAAEEGTAPPAPPRTLAETKDALRRAAETRATRASETSKATDAIETIEAIETIDATEKAIEGDARQPGPPTRRRRRPTVRARVRGVSARTTRTATSPTNPSRGWFRRDGEGSDVGNRGDGRRRLRICRAVVRG